MIAVDYHADLKEVQSDARLADLLDSPAQTNPFDRLAWWRGLEEHCGVKPLLAVAREGAAVAIMPLTIGGGEIAALSNWYSFRWKPVISPEADPSPLLTAIGSDIARRGGRVILAGVPDEEGEARTLASAFQIGRAHV